MPRLRGWGNPFWEERPGVMGTRATMVVLPPPEAKEERGAVAVGLLVPSFLHRGLFASSLGRVGVVAGTCLAPAAARRNERTRVERQLAADPRRKVRLKLINEPLFRYGTYMPVNVSGHGWQVGVQNNSVAANEHTCVVLRREAMRFMSLSGVGTQ